MHQPLANRIMRRNLTGRICLEVVKLSCEVNQAAHTLFFPGMYYRLFISSTLASPNQKKSRSNSVAKRLNDILS